MEDRRVEAPSAQVPENADKWGRRQAGVLAGLLAFAIVYSLAIAQGLLIPIVAAIVLGLLLWPVVNLLRRILVPPAFGAALVVTFIAGMFFIGFYTLSTPVADWVGRVPVMMNELQFKLRELRAPMAEMQEASRQVEEATNGDSGGAEPQKVVVEQPSLLRRLFGTIQDVGAQISVTVVLLYFLLATGDLFRDKVLHVLSSRSDKHRALVIFQQVQSDVARYLVIVAMINVGLGVVIGAGFWFAGMPNAAMWGAMAGLLNFMPYVGMLIGVVAVTVAGVLSFPELSQTLVVIAIYLGANFFEAQFITPSILSRRLTLNPVVVFLSVVVWAYLWSIPGALLAVPLLVICKALCDHVPGLASIGEFLSGERPKLSSIPPAKAQ